MQRSVPLTLLSAVCAAALLTAASPARAVDARSDDAVLPAAKRPRVKLDRLSLPADLAHAKEYELHLRKTLQHEVRRADWGSGANATISYRFFVQRLDLREEAGVLHVTCSALGRLPKGKSAKSHLEFGGDPREQRRVVERVLDIVARGVVTRLAELERARRTP